MTQRKPSVKEPSSYDDRIEHLPKEDQIWLDGFLHGATRNAEKNQKKNRKERRQL